MPGKKISPGTGSNGKGKKRKEKFINGHITGLSLSPPNSARLEEEMTYINADAEEVYFEPSNVDGNILDKWKALVRPVETVSKWRDYVARRRPISENSKAEYREGPAPRPNGKAIKMYEYLNLTHKGIGSDLEDDDEQNSRAGSSLAGQVNGGQKPYSRNDTVKLSTAGNRALIIYFSKLASGKDEEDEIDLDFVESLLNGGADINTADRFGQTILHEIARAWHTDVADFVLRHRADINKPDRYGRTPLHVAAAVDYPEMIKFLVDKGAELHARTYEEYQTPIHYAAKNDAVKALKMLIKLGSSVHDRDYKERTPLQVSAELDRSETAKYLIDLGVPAGVMDSSGMPVLSLMIDKMPLVAKEALNQFHTTERANRKQYFFINYLEPKLPGQNALSKQPLQHAVDSKQMDLLLHPVMQRLIEIKWKEFGKLGCWKQVVIQLFFVLVWTAIGLTLPKDSKYYPSEPFKNWWYRVLFEVLAVMMTMYNILQEIWEYRSSSSSHQEWKAWRTKELKRDLHYCHPRWPEERKYLEQELERLEATRISYFHDAWNFFDWVTYIWIFAVIISRLVVVLHGSSLAKIVHPRILALALIFIWLRLMKVMRAFRSLGPFIVMISHIFSDILKFGFLYFEFYIPYVCAFWIIFGGSSNAATMRAAGQSSKDWENLNDLIYTVWIITVVGDFTFDSLTTVDRLMAQFLVGTYIALSGVVMLNLFIALMSDTFQRVYDNAKANAIMQQASLILSIEQAMSRRRRDKFRRYVHSCCNPEEVYYDDDDETESGQLEKMTIQIKEVVDEIEEAVKADLAEGGLKAHTDRVINKLKEETFQTLGEYSKAINAMNTKIDKLTELLTEFMKRDGKTETPSLPRLPAPSELSESFRLQTESIRDSPNRPGSRRGSHRKKPEKQYGPSEETRRDYNRRSRMKVSHLTAGVEGPHESEEDSGQET